MSRPSIAVIGAGSWGTTIANHLALKENDVTLWIYEKLDYQYILEKKQNPRYLPGVFLSDNLKPTMNLQEAVENSDIVVLGVPSHVVRTISQQMKPFLSSETIIVNLAKGIENDTLLRMSEVIHEVSQVPYERIVVLYGPSHAEEVSRKVPTAVVSACVDLEAASKIQTLFFSDYFRVYTSDDVIGVELGGSVKNVIAIAAGVCDGVGFGDNTKAALITRALAEISRLGVAMGAQSETFAGLSGMGDLIVTCMSKHSRNRFVGEKISQGLTLQKIIDSMNMVAEGVKTTRSVYQLMRKTGIDMPICRKVYDVLFNGQSPVEAVNDLMLREVKREQFGQ